MNIDMCRYRYQNEQDAYAAATVCQMQSIEKLSAKWPKSMLADKQESIMELCRCIKEDFKSYKERFAYMTLQCNQIFPNLEYDQHRILPVEANNNIPSHSISESIFKTKVRNFMDVLRTRSDVEEDLGNSEDDDEDDEEEEENEGEEDDGGEEDIDDGEEEDMEDEDIEEEDVGEEADEGVDEDEDIQAEEEEEEEDDPVTSETVIQEHSEEEESEDQERPMLKRDASSLLEDGDAEDDEEDEIDEDEGDEDELADDDDESVKRRRVVA